jgi:hypothetical protein
MLILDELQQLMSGGPSAAGAGDENNTHNLVRLVRSAATFTRNTDLWFINLLASHRYIITAGKARHASRYKMSFIKRIQITHEEAVNSIRSDSKELLKEFVNNLSSGKKTILYFKVPNVNWIAVLFSLQKFDKLASAKKKTINTPSYSSPYATRRPQFQSMGDHLGSCGIKNTKGNNAAMMVLNYLTFPALRSNTENNESTLSEDTILAVTEDWIDIYTSFSFTLLSGKNGTLAHPLLIRQFIYPDIKIARPLLHEPSSKILGNAVHNQNPNPNQLRSPTLQLLPPYLTQPLFNFNPTGPNRNGVIPLPSPSFSQFLGIKSISLPPQYQQIPLYSQPLPSTTLITSASSYTEPAGCFLKQWLVIYWITTVLNKYHHNYVHLMLDNKDTMINKNHYQFLFGYLSLFNLNYYQIFHTFYTWSNARKSHLSSTSSSSSSSSSEPTPPHSTKHKTSVPSKETHSGPSLENKKRKFASITEDSIDSATTIPLSRPVKMAKTKISDPSSISSSFGSSGVKDDSSSSSSSSDHHSDLAQDKQAFSNYANGKSTVISALMSLIYIKTVHVITVDTLNMLYDLFYPRRRKFYMSLGPDGQKELHGVDPSNDIERVNRAKILQTRYPVVSKIIKYLAGLKSVTQESLRYFSLDTNTMTHTTFLKIAKMDHKLMTLLSLKYRLREEEPLVGAARTREEVEYEHSNEYSVENSSSISKVEHATILFGSEYKFDPSKRERAMEARIRSSATIDGRHPITELQHINQWILDEYEAHTKNNNNNNSGTTGSGYSSTPTETDPNRISVVAMEPEQMILSLYSLCHEASPLTQDQKITIMSGIWLHPKKESIITPKDPLSCGGDGIIEGNKKNSFKSIIECYSFLNNNRRLFKKRIPEIPIKPVNKTILNAHNIHVWIAAIELISLYLPPSSSPEDVSITTPVVDTSRAAAAADRNNSNNDVKMKEKNSTEEIIREDSQETVMDGIAKLPFMNTTQSPKIYQSYFEFIVPSVKIQQEQGYGNYIINATESTVMTRKSQRLRVPEGLAGASGGGGTSYSNQYTKINTFAVDDKKTLWDDETLMIYNVTSTFLTKVSSTIATTTINTAPHNNSSPSPSNDPPTKKMMDEDSESNMEDSAEKESTELATDLSFLNDYFSKDALEQETKKCYSLFMELIYSRYVKHLLKNKI